MNNLELLKVAEQLVKNLMWLEVGNPLLTSEELLTFGIKYSCRMAQQYNDIKDIWTNEIGKMKSLTAMLRYIQDAQLSIICSLYAPPYIETKASEQSGQLRKPQILAGVEYSDLSLPMARGRSKELGGGSRRKSRTA